MTTNFTGTTVRQDQQEAESMFASILGLADVDTVVESAGSRDFLKFQVGSRAPIYDHAIEKTGQQLGKRNIFRGMMGIREKAARAFPGSMESKVLAAVLTRSTRTISQDGNAPEWGLEHVPFRNSEDSKLMQPATHIVVGRRGVGKSTLIVKVVQSLRKAGRPCVVIDMQRFAHRNDKSLDADVLSDLTHAILAAVEGNHSDLSRPMASLRALRVRLAGGTISAHRAVMPLSEHIRTITTALDKDLFVFLDDFHLIDSSRQAALLDLLHGCLKGARGWLKVAAIESLLRHYDAKSRKGLQIP